MRDDQMMCGVDGDLDIVADDAGAAPARRHRAGIRISQRYLLIRSSEHLLLENLKKLHLLLQLCNLLSQAAHLGLEGFGLFLPISGVELLQIRATLSSICAMRRSILARVKFLSRLLTALNLLPSMRRWLA